MHGPFMTIYHPLVTLAGQHASAAMWALRALCAAPLLLRGVALPRPDGALLAHLLFGVEDHPARAARGERLWGRQLVMRCGNQRGGSSSGNVMMTPMPALLSK